VSMGVQFAYNSVRGTPLTTYAEVAILFPQLVMLAIVSAWADGYLGMKVWLGCACICTGTAAMALEAVPRAVTMACYAANASLGLFTVIPQVVINYQNKSTGQLSWLVTCMTFGGVSTRLFTTFVEVDDIALKLSTALNWSLIALLMAQFLIYRDTRPLPPKPKLFAYPGPAPRPELKKAKSMVAAISAYGSSRCLSEMVDAETVDVIKSASSNSLTRIAGSFTALPAVSNSVPDFLPSMAPVPEQQMQQMRFNSQASTPVTLRRN